MCVKFHHRQIMRELLDVPPSVKAKRTLYIGSLQNRLTSRHSILKKSRQCTTKISVLPKFNNNNFVSTTEMYTESTNFQIRLFQRRPGHGTTVLQLDLNI